ncbi:MAG: cytochrome P460 family protein [Pseudomonadota bacterium]
MIKTVATLALALGASVLLTSTAAYSQDCRTDKDPYDLTADEVNGLYSCISDALAEGYAKGDNEVAAVYRSWAPTATGPAVPGVHGERFLMTFANDIAAEQYIKYQDDGDFVMPTGSVLAKESFKVTTKEGDNKGKVRRGPLFIMTKVGTEAEEHSDGWLYSAVQPNGKAMRIKQSFCHDCHVAFDTQDSMGYPAFDVRFEQ